jgi:hypothetical protein
MTKVAPSSRKSAGPPLTTFQDMIAGEWVSVDPIEDTNRSDTNNLWGVAVSFIEFQMERLSRLLQAD